MATQTLDIQQQALPPQQQQDPQQQQAPQVDPDFPFGENGENLPQDMQDSLKQLAVKFMEEDRYSRRLEIQEARRARYFWRGMQHLSWNWKSEGWEIMGPGGATMGSYAQAEDSAVLYVTNIYQAFGLSIQAVLTQNMPSVRFEPQKATDPADIDTAAAAEDLRKIIEHQNDAVMLLTQLSYYSWTDGRVVGFTRWEIDKRTGQERETISVGGALEWKVPITTECAEDFVYVINSDEYHVAIIREEVSTLGFPDEYERKIVGGAHGSGEDVYERTARISTKQGVSLLTQSGDTLSHLVTRENCWMRKAAFQQMEDNDKRKTLAQAFPNGVRVRHDNGIYTGCWADSIDDHITVMHPLPGDGQYRNSIGFSLISVQERFNDIVNITQDTYEKGIPAAWVDDKAVDSDGVVRQVSKPGARYPFPKRPNEAIPDSFFFEPAASVSADMLKYAEDLMGPISQFLTGAFPALMGNPESKNDTASGYAMQRDQAMGRIGIIWRAIKRFWARVMEQAVRCGATHRTEDASLGIPDEDGEIETTTVRLEDLQGKVYCYPDSDENFPVSYSQKKAAFMQLITQAAQSPELQAMIFSPDNVALAQDLVGLQDFQVPGADSDRMQLAQIAMMLKSGQPIPIDPFLDDNAAMLAAGKRWANSADGQKAKAATPEGFIAVRNQLIQRQQIIQQAALAAQQAQAAMQPPPHAAPPPK